MAANKGGLGKGLNALFAGAQTGAPTGKDNVQEIETDKIQPNRYQPREDFDEASLSELTDSVKPASVPSLLRPLVETGMVAKVDVKIPGKGTQRGYIKA